MNFKIINPIIAALVFLSVGFVSTADAGEIRLHKTDPTKFAFVGEVVEGDAQMLRDFLVENQTVTDIILYSGGGSVSEGIEMMQIINLRGLNTSIPKDFVCYSICSFMWLGGTERTVDEGGKLGVHQPFAPTEIATEMGAEAYAQDIIRTLAWMMYEVEILELDVDNWWWMMMMNTPAGDMHVFERDELEVFER